MSLFLSSTTLASQTENQVLRKLELTDLSALNEIAPGVFNETRIKSLNNQGEDRTSYLLGAFSGEGALLAAMFVDGRNPRTTKIEIFASNKLMQDAVGPTYDGVNLLAGQAIGESPEKTVRTVIAWQSALGDGRTAGLTVINALMKGGLGFEFKGRGLNEVYLERPGNSSPECVEHSQVSIAL